MLWHSCFLRNRALAQEHTTIGIKTWKEQRVLCGDVGGLAGERTGNSKCSVMALTILPEMQRR